MKRLVFRFGGTALLLLAALLPLPKAEAETLRYALNHWPPYSISDTSDYRGIDVDVVLEIARRIGVQIQFRKCPFKRCLKEMELGNLDLMSGIARNDTREVYMAYALPPYHSVSVVFHVQAGQSGLVQRYEDLTGLRVGMVASSHYFEPFNSDDTLNKVIVHDERLLPRMLEAGRIDTYVGTNPNAAFDLLNMGLREHLVPAEYDPGVEVPLHFAMSRKSDRLNRLQDVAKVIAEIHQDGTMARILTAYR